MTILLQWLVEHAWIFYAVCAVGMIIYLLRAWAAHRERSLALFTLERETATARIVRAWAMVVVFAIIAALVFGSTTFVLPTLPIYSAGTPPPTPTLAAGMEPPTAARTPTPTPTFGPLVATFTPTATTGVAPTVPPPQLTETPTPEPTDTPEGAITGDLSIRFGDFAELIGYSLPAAEVRAGQPLPLTLYWRGLESTNTANYLVFTHLLADDGHIVAQHDGPPANGTRPTGEWAPGEVVTDPHSMAFQDTAYVGSATLAVGLYDPGVGRVLTGAGGDRVVLPIAINVVP
jgi:hypothetical protein